MKREIGVLLLVAATTSCVLSPSISVPSARLLEDGTEVSDNRGNSVTARGYLLFTISSDTDLVRTAAEHGAQIWYSAETCDSHIKLNGPPDLYERGEDDQHHSYSALSAYKDSKGGKYNLAHSSEDVCIRVGFGSMNPLSNAQSLMIRFSLSEGLRAALRKYDAEGGIVEFRLSPNCAARLCAPTYRKAKSK